MIAAATMAGLGGGLILAGSVLAARAMDLPQWQTARRDLLLAAVLFGAGLALMGLVVQGVA